VKKIAKQFLHRGFHRKRLYSWLIGPSTKSLNGRGFTLGELANMLASKVMEAFRLGAKGFIRKPFAPDEIRDKLAAFFT